MEPGEAWPTSHRQIVPRAPTDTSVPSEPTVAPRLVADERQQVRPGRESDREDQEAVLAGWSATAQREGAPQQLPAGQPERPPGAERAGAGGRRVLIGGENPELGPEREEGNGTLERARQQHGTGIEKEKQRLQGPASAG